MAAAPAVMAASISFDAESGRKSAIQTNLAPPLTAKT